MLPFAWRVPQLICCGAPLQGPSQLGARGAAGLIGGPVTTPSLSGRWMLAPDSSGGPSLACPVALGRCRMQELVATAHRPVPQEDAAGLFQPGIRVSAGGRSRLLLCLRIGARYITVARPREADRPGWMLDGLYGRDLDAHHFHCSVLGFMGGKNSTLSHPDLL